MTSHPGPDRSRPAPPVVRSPASADVFVLSCMDYRLVDDVTGYVQRQGLDERYSEMRIAGGGLAAVDGARPAWVETVWENVAASRQLHGIRRLLVINHRDCGAVGQRFGRAAVADPDAEFRLHVRICQEVVDEAARRDPTLEVECGFMELDGRVRRIETGPPRASRMSSLPAAAPDRRATFVERVRARLSGRPTLDRQSQFELLQAAVTEHGMSAEEANATLRATVASAEGRLGRDGDRAVESLLQSRAGSRRRISRDDFEAAARLLRMGNEGNLTLDAARQRVKTMVQSLGLRPRGTLWPPFSRRWFNRI